MAVFLRWSFCGHRLRGLIRDRRAAGLTQDQLAKMAKVRQETVSRIESGKHTATAHIMEKLDAAIHSVKVKGRAPRRQWRR